MNAAGIKPERIAEFLCQEIDTLIPYEVSNQMAVETLKRVEEKGLLIGKSFNKTKKEEKNPILLLLDNFDVVQKNKENFIQKINNPKEAMSLSLGECMEPSNYDVCGDLFCMACDEYNPNNLEEAYEFGIKMMKFCYVNKRKNIMNLKSILSML